VAATLRGHRDARQRLERAGLAGKLRLDRLDFIEVLEDRAINALRAAQDSVSVDRAWPAPSSWMRPSAPTRADSGAPAPWTRATGSIAISTVGGTDDGAPRLMFDVGELARAERTYNAVPFKDIERFTQSLIGTTTDQEQVGRALFELLIPNWLKDLAPTAGASSSSWTRLPPPTPGNCCATGPPSTTATAANPCRCAAA
jgi:hypothetical protein